MHFVVKRTEKRMKRMECSASASFLTGQAKSWLVSKKTLLRETPNHCALLHCSGLPFHPQRPPCSLEAQGYARAAEGSLGFPRSCCTGLLTARQGAERPASKNAEQFHSVPPFKCNA